MLINAMSLQKEFFHGNTETKAVRDGSLAVAAGESVAIIGPSGCGKTTLLNMIGLIITPTKGELYIQGSDAKLFSSKRRAEYRNKFFGYVVQDFALVEDCTVMENVEIPLLYNHQRIGRRVRRRKVENALSAVGLPAIIKEEVKNLSGGQRQRVAIARALVNDPQVILADEPTGSLDLETGRTIFNLLMEMVHAGKNLILVTHNLELASECSRQLNMIDGCTFPASPQDVVVCD